jgi:hypothetical protein
MKKESINILEREWKYLQKQHFFEYEYEFIFNVKFWANSELKQWSINILLCEEETKVKD